MMLRQRKGCYDPKDLEGVLPVLDRCLYDGGDGGVVLRSGLRAEASANLELGLRGSEGLLTVVVRRRDSKICQEGEDVVPVLGDALFEVVQFGVGTVGLCIDRRPCKKFIKSLLHLRPHLRPDISLVPMVNGVSQKIQHIKTPIIIREGLHRVCEVPQQVCDAYLVVLHPDVSHEVCRPAVGHPDFSAKFLWGEVVCDGSVTPAAVEGEICRNVVLEGPEPVVPAVDVDSGLIRSGNFAAGHLLAYHRVGFLGELPHRVQHIGYGPLAYVKPEDCLQQVCQPFERDILICAQVGHEGRDVGAEVYRGIHSFRELPLAAVAATALDLHHKVVYDLRLYRKRDVNLLSSGTHGGGVHIQGLAAHGADSGRIPALGSGDIISLEPRASRMSLLSARLLSGGLALGLRVRNAYGVLRRRHAAVCAGLDYWPMTGLEFHNTSLQLFDFLFLPCYAAVKDIICADLLVKFFRQLRRVKILGVSHLTKELFAPTGKFYPIGFEAPSKPCIEVLFHTTKIRKRNGSTKFNKLCINGLKAIYGLSDKLDTPLFGGSSRKFLRASLRLQNSSNRLIFNGLEAKYAMQ